MNTSVHPLTWLKPRAPFPSTEMAWPADSDAPGLLAAGGALDVPTLLEAYRNAIFPWFGEGQPILWWSPDPRMVLKTNAFRVHRSMRRTLLRFTQDPLAEIRMDTAFNRVIASCAKAKRKEQLGTWIMPDMVDAYTQLHAAGFAHSVETWINGELVGGLYCVNIGKALFGESMFAHKTNASKIALSALVAWSRVNSIEMIDCQQNTNHLASLGAAEVPRSVFSAHVSAAANTPSPRWTFNPLYWDTILQR